MSNFKDYILAVVGIAVCCGIIKKMIPSKGISSDIVSVACGIVIAIVVISPVVSVKIPQLSAYTASVQAEAQRYAEDGKKQSRSQMESIILEQTHAYIRDKAAALGCDVEVLLSLSDDSIPVPDRVAINGAFTPYAKAQLTQQIESELGIPKEMQKWNYQN